jgi:hypothetical protein
MTGTELISEAISYYDNTLATDATNANRRLRVLHNAQMVLDEIYNTRAWPFKHHKVDVDVEDGEVSLPCYPQGKPVNPANGDGISFGRLGQEGAVYEAATGQFWTETTLQEIIALRAAQNSQRKLFTIGSVSGPSGIYQLIIPNTATVGPTLTVFFDVAPGKLVDNTSEIGAIPYQYHRTVLLAGTIVRMQTSKSDVREFWLQQYGMGLARMVANEMILQSRVKQMPMYQRGQW